MPRSVPPAILLAGALTLGLPLATRAELPPWVYGEQQRQAPLVAKLEVVQTLVVGDDLKARCKVLTVVRQPPHGQLKAGQGLVVRYSRPLPPPRPPGPSALPEVRKGERITAWLRPIPGTVGVYAPAAGGKSFGPSLEDMKEP